MSEQPNFAAPVLVTAEMSLENDNVLRYQFTLNGYEGETSRLFIIDVPPTDIGTTDVWVSDSIVEVGDTPMDGFATFAPADTTDKAYRLHHDGYPKVTDEELVAALAPVEMVKLAMSGKSGTIGTGKNDVRVTVED